MAPCRFNFTSDGVAWLILKLESFGGPTPFKALCAYLRGRALGGSGSWTTKHKHALRVALRQAIQCDKITQLRRGLYLANIPFKIERPGKKNKRTPKSQNIPRAITFDRIRNIDQRRDYMKKNM